MTVLDIMTAGVGSGFGDPDRNSAANASPARDLAHDLRIAEAARKSPLVLAVDIGAQGAAALLDEAGDPIDVVDLPTLDSGPACRPEISPHLLASIVRRWRPARAWVEQIGPRLGDRPVGAFAFGASKATVEAVLACCRVPFRSITPATWKRAVGIPAGQGMKGLARSRAIERWLAHAEAFARVMDHDRAEAALIGWAGLQRERAGR